MNTVNDMFMVASQKKLRFKSGKGLLTVEDLWDLSLESLDNIAIELDETIQKEGRKSFVSKRSSASTEKTLALDIVKVVIEVKQDEAEKRKDRADKRAQKEFLEKLLEEKNIESLKGLSKEEIEKRIAALNT
jgi:hypothetical protein